MADRSTIQAVSDGLNKLEHKHHALDTDVRLLARDVSRNREDLSEMASYFRWFMKVVIALFASAVVAFIVQGGLV